MISGKTRLVAVIGRPIGHSLSPAMHNASFAADGLDFVYVALDVGPERVSDAVRGAAALGLRGFNVTMPHKRAVVPLMDELDESARISGAVNTVVIDGPKLSGHNTDGSGLVQACKEAGAALAGHRIVLLGAGGAAASIATAFCDAGVEVLHIVNRSIEHAGLLSEKLRGAGKTNRIEVHPPDFLNEPFSGETVVVNATPLGMKEEDPLPFPPERLDEGSTMVDAVYRPGVETAVIREARGRGVRVVTGERMLLYQGVLAQKLWTGRQPNVRAMAAALS